MLLIADDNDLLCSGDGAQSIFRSHLARFINQKQVEFNGSRRQELGHRNRAHHQDRLNSLYGLSRLQNEFSDRGVRLLLPDLTTNKPHGAQGASRDLIEMKRPDFSHAILSPLNLQLLKTTDRVVSIKVAKVGEPGIPPYRRLPYGFRPRKEEFGLRRFA